MAERDTSRVAPQIANRVNDHALVSHLCINLRLYPLFHNLVAELLQHVLLFVWLWSFPHVALFQIKKRYTAKNSCHPTFR